MSLRYDLSGVAGFDQEFDFCLTYAGVPLNLAGCTVTLTLKASATTDDALAIHVYAEGTGLTMTSAADGQFTWDAPAADVAIDAPGALWYRVDVASGDAGPQPAMYGALALTAA
jgi:hypothetical protein